MDDLNKTYRTLVWTMNYREQMLLRTFVQQGVLCWGQVGACSEDGKGSMNGWLI